MKHLIKNKKLVVSLNTTGNTTELIIKKNNLASHLGITRLGDVLKALPHGIIYKGETGMGATTLELETPRNSIIVEPIKITASSKAYKHSVSDDKKVLYVGSETKFHNKRISKNDITQYLNNKSIIYKKIIVVADSLYKVFDVMTPAMFPEYFLMIDEADSFQMDSTYRKSMEDCIEMYKRWYVDQKCMVSATMINFSDPYFENEQSTHILYDKSTQRDINVLLTSNIYLKGVAFDSINNLIINTSDKILVAYNSVTNIYDIAEELKTQNIIDAKEISILCSRASKEKVGDYYKELDGDTLPTRVNFITSAYFSGFDLNERYHLISISGNINIAHVLSDKKIKQIAGRCRVQLLSETIIHDTLKLKKPPKPILMDELINIANIEIDSLKCLKKHFSKNKQLKELHSKINDVIMSALDDNNSRYIKNEFAGNDLVISYLNIDAVVENNNTQLSIYTKSRGLFEILKNQGHSVKLTAVKSSTHITVNKLDEKNREVLVKSIINIIKTTDAEILDEVLEQMKLAPIQMKIYKAFSDYSKYVDKDNLLSLLEEKAKKRDTRALNNFITSLNYLTLAPGSLYRSRVDKYFPIGSEFSVVDIVKRWNLILLETQISKEIDTPVKGTRILKSHFKCKKDRKGNFKLINNNPYKIKVLKTRPELEDIKTLQDLIFAVNESPILVDISPDELDFDISDTDSFTI